MFVAVAPEWCATDSDPRKCGSIIAILDSAKFPGSLKAFSRPVRFKIAVPAATGHQSLCGMLYPGGGGAIVTLWLRQVQLHDRVASEEVLDSGKMSSDIRNGM